MTTAQSSFATAWMDEEVLDEIAKESNSAYINPSKLEEKKAHRFRCFGRAISGFECWYEQDGKSLPRRFHQKPADDELPAGTKTDDKGNPQLKRFIATLVWDYQAEAFKILQMTQKSLRDDLFKYARDPDYGDPQGYDIKITRTGSGLDTEYALVPSPPKAVDKAVAKQYEEFYCDLDQLFAGEDPFKRPA